MMAKKHFLAIGLVCLGIKAFAQGITPVNVWTPGGGNIYFNGGNVGIGLNSPLYPLHVNGNALFMKGLTARAIVATSLSADTIRMDTNKVIQGSTILNDALKVRKDLAVGGNLNVSKNSNFSGVITATGIKANTLDLSQGLSFGGGLSKLTFSATTQGGGMFILGPPNINLQSGGCNIPVTPVPGYNGPIYNNVMPGRLQIYNTDGPGGSASPNNVLTLQTDAYGASIDLAGYSTNSGNPNDAMAINYYCGKDVFICNNPANGGGSNANGGVVRMGQNVEIGGPISDYNSALNIRASGTKALTIQEANYGPIFSVDGQGSTIINCLSATQSPLVVKNTNATVPGLPSYATTFFEINPAGQVYIGTQRPNSSNTRNALLNVFGNINTTALYVTDPNSKWADFVFDREYKLMTLSDLENYYEKNHHLPDVPSEKDVRINGNNIGETEIILLQKIEELTLYIVEQDKQIKKINEELKDLRKKQ